MVKEELVKKIRPNDPRVLERLRLDDIPDSFVDACFANFDEDNKDHIIKLLNIEQKSLRGKEDNELKMHEPLVSEVLDQSRSSSDRICDSSY